MEVKFLFSCNWFVKMLFDAGIDLAVLNCGYSGLLADLLNVKSPSYYDPAAFHPMTPSSSHGHAVWGLISSECGLLWLHTKPHVDIPGDRALCKHTRPHQMAGWGRIVLRARDAEEDQEETARSEGKSLLPAKCQTSPVVHKCVTQPDVCGSHPMRNLSICYWRRRNVHLVSSSALYPWGHWKVIFEGRRVNLGAFAMNGVKRPQN